MNRKHIVLKTFTAADLAESDSEKADSTVILSGGFSGNGHLFLLEKWSKQGSESTEILREVIRHMRFYQSSGGFIEKNRFESIMRTCRKLVKAGFYGDTVQVNKIINRIKQIPHYGVSKMDRFRDTIGQYSRSKMIWMRKDWNDVRDFFINYPAVDHDDIGDCIDMLIEYGSAPSKNFIQISKREGSDNPREYQPEDVNAYFAKKKVNIYTGVAK